MKKFLVAFTLIVTNAFGMSFNLVGSNVLEVSGPIIDSDYAKFKDVFAENKIHTVIFKNSPGGDVQTGNLIAYFMDDFQLLTVVDGYCRSQCTVLFLAGRQRKLMNSESYLAFHSAYRYDGNGIYWPGVLEQQRVYSKAMGNKYDEELFDKVARTSIRDFIVFRGLEFAKHCTYGKIEREVHSCKPFKNKNIRDIGAVTE